MLTTLHYTRRRHHHHTGSDPNPGQVAYTENRIDKALLVLTHPHLFLRDNHIQKRRGSGSRNMKMMQEHTKIRMRGNRSTKSHTTDRGVAELLTLSPP